MCLNQSHGHPQAHSDPVSDVAIIILIFYVLCI